MPVQEPTGRGFDKAARILAERFLAPTEVGGKSLVGVRTQVPILFTAESLDASPVIGKPRWMAVPKLADLQAVLPPAAQKAGVLHARVVLRCRVAAGGAVDDCKVASETPAGLGYGAATLALAPTFRISVWSQEGLPTVGGVLDIPVRYDLAALRPSAAAAKP